MNDATRKGVSQEKAAALQRIQLPESDAVFDNPRVTDDNPIDSELQEATRSGDPDSKMPRNPRDDVIDKVHARVEEARQAEVAQARAEGLLGPADTAEDEEPVAVQQKQSAKPVVEDELSQFTVKKDGKLMFKTVVNGREELIPLKRAQEQLQKAEAAEVRMARAAEFERSVKARENQILAREQAMVAGPNASKPATLPGSPPGEGDQRPREETLLQESRELVASLFTGSEEQAAAKLTKILADSRRIPIQAPVNPEELVQRAVTAVRQKMSEEDTAQDVVAGYRKFGDDYPEVLADSNLYRYADSLTNTIADENPTWKPSEVMLEAGKRTREWVQSLKSPEPTAKPNNDRQSRKDKLVPMPRSASARRESTPHEEPVETPQSMFAEIRKSRGQAR